MGYRTDALRAYLPPPPPRFVLLFLGVEKRDVVSSVLCYFVQFEQRGCFFCSNTFLIAVGLSYISHSSLDSLIVYLVPVQPQPRRLFPLPVPHQSQVCSAVAPSAVLKDSERGRGTLESDYLLLLAAAMILFVCRLRSGSWRKDEKTLKFDEYNFEEHKEKDSYHQQRYGEDEFDDDSISFMFMRQENVRPQVPRDLSSAPAPQSSYRRAPSSLIYVVRQKKSICTYQPWICTDVHTFRTILHAPVMILHIL